jgi:RNA polymerase sigma-70 factor, ECF subfamily
LKTSDPLAASKMPAQTIHSPPNEADRAWFADQIDALLPELYGRAVRLCRHRTNAEDLVADAVAKAWEALASLEDREAFRGWVFRILNNTFVSNCRSARSTAEHEPLDTTGDDFSLFERLHQPILLWWGSPETDFLNRLLREDLERSIDGLPDAFREVVVLVDVQGLAYREVAELLDVPIGTVRSRLSRGRSLLQAALWEHGLESGLTKGPGDPKGSETTAHDQD